MTLTVLSDDQIQSLLENLTLSDLHGFQAALASALHEYSSSTRSQNGDASVHQPERISVQSKATGATTLFMPSCNSTANAVKVTLTTATSLPSPTTPSIPPTGTITLLKPDGTPHGLLHARTLTAFRTALASLPLLQHRRLSPSQPTTLLVFGTGLQAYWHARLALLACGAAFCRVVFVSWRKGGTGLAHVVGRFSEIGVAVREKEGWGGCRFSGLAKGEEGFEGALRVVLGWAGVVVCCTPSREVLFDAEVGGWDGSRGRGRLVVAVGSYTPEMREVPRGLVERAVKGGEGEGSVVIVDTREGALKEAGELIEAGVRPEQMVELGELVRKDGKIEEDLALWLETGNVLYKSVGLGLMDLSVGMHLIEFAKEKGVGTFVPGF